MSSSVSAALRPAGATGRPVPAALLALSAIPLVAGSLRLLQLAGRVSNLAVAEHLIRRTPARRRRATA